MDPAVTAAVAEAHRRDWGFVLAATNRITRDLDAAEDCVQEAYAQALTAWANSGVPTKPAAWLTVVARRRSPAARRQSGRTRLPQPPPQRTRQLTATQRQYPARAESQNAVGQGRPPAAPARHDRYRRASSPRCRLTAVPVGSPAGPQTSTRGRR